MALFNEFGFDDLISDLQALAALPDEVIEDMLKAEAAVVEKAQKAELRSMGHVKSGQLADSIKMTEAVRAKGGARLLYVYPQGSRSDKKVGRGNTEVGFVLECGSPHKNISAKNWMKRANEKCHEEAVKEAEKVYDNYLKKNNL